jgi:Immunity protein 8
MKPKLKAQDCTDHDPIELWQPPEPDQVDYWLCLHIGSDESPGADLFYVRVISEAAAKALDPGEIDRSKSIVLPAYSWDAVMRAVDDILLGCKEGSWEEVAAQLSQKFDWEFENYQP